MTGANDKRHCPHVGTWDVYLDTFSYTEDAALEARDSCPKCPPIEAQQCCHCGTRRALRGLVAEGHGKFAPPITRVSPDWSDRCRGDR